MTARPATLDGRAAWLVASAALAILTIAYGAPLIAAVALKPIAAELATSRSAPAAAGSFTYVGAAFGGIVAGWLSGRIGIRWIVIFGAAMLAAGLAVSATGGLTRLYLGHGVLMGLFGTACMFSPLMTYVSRWFRSSPRCRRGADLVRPVGVRRALAGGLPAWHLAVRLARDHAGVRAVRRRGRSCCWLSSSCIRRQRLRHRQVPPGSPRKAASRASACRQTP